MANIRKQYSDYKKLGDSLGLRFLETVAPYRVRDSCKWECLNCGRLIQTSFSNLSASSHGCLCQIGITNDREKYTQLAEHLSLMWVGTHLPANVKEITTWFSLVTKQEFQASYSDIGYKIIKSKFRKHIAVRDGNQDESPGLAASG